MQASLVDQFVDPPSPYSTWTVTLRHAKMRFVINYSKSKY